MSSKKVDNPLTPTTLLQQLADYAQLKHLIIAYSGGADSHVLLHLLAACRTQQPAQRVTAVHVNHRLQKDADVWQQHCERICAELAIDFRALSVNADANPGESPEAAARKARYRALAELIDQKTTALLTAHHRNDQAETLLLQLLRGAGPAGLAAMPAAKPFAKGLLLRPLLAFERRDILAYAHHYQLDWIEDPSNHHLEFDRNYIRHEILPKLILHWPGTLKTLTRSAELCAESAQLCEEIGDDDIISLIENNNISIPALLILSPQRQRNALRRWLQQQRLNLPSRVQLQRIFDEVIPAAHDRQPLLSWPGGEIRRYQNQLYAMPPLAPHDARQVIAWCGVEPLSIPAIGTLRLVSALAQQQSLDARRLQQLSIRFRHGGETLPLLGQLPGQVQQRSLKKLFYEAGIPPWQRDRIPLLYSADTLVAVADLWVAAPFVVNCDASDNVNSVVLQWQKFA